MWFLIILCLMPVSFGHYSLNYHRFYNYVVEFVATKCFHHDLLSSFLADLSAKPQGQFMMDETCWQEVSIEYKFTKSECDKASLVKASAFALSGRGDAFIVIITDDCDYVEEISYWISSIEQKHNVLTLVPKFCHLQNPSSLKQVEFEPMNFKKDFVQRIMSTTNLDFQSNQHQIVFIRDREITKISSDSVIHLGSTSGVLLNYYSCENIKINELKSIFNASSPLLITLACNKEMTQSIFQEIGRLELFKIEHLAWVVFTRNNFDEFKPLTDFQYNTNMLLIHENDKKIAYNLSTLLEIVFLKFQDGKPECYVCSPCEMPGAKVSIYRVAQDEKQQKLMCITDIDTWGITNRVGDKKSVWEPKFLKMDGINFKIAVFEEVPYFTLNRSTCPPTGSGFLFDLLEIFKESYNFNYSFYLSNKEYESKKAGRFSNLIGDVANRVTHIGLSSMQMNDERSEIVDFLHTPVIYGGAKLLYYEHSQNKYEPSSPWRTVYTRPFEPDVWLFILATTMMCTLAFTATETCYWKVSNKNKENIPDEAWFLYPVDNLLYMYSALVQQGWEKTPNKMGSRVIVIFFRFFAAIMYAGYSAMIISQYIVERPESRFTSLEQVIENKAYRLGTLKGSVYEYNIQTAKDEVYQRVWKKITEDPENRVDNLEQMLNKIFTEKFIGIYDENFVDYFIASNCSFMAVPQPILRTFNTIIMNKNSPYTSAFAYRLGKLNEAGITNRLKIKWFQGKVCSQEFENQKKTDQEKIDLKHVTIPISVSLAGISAAIVFLIIEICFMNVSRVQEKFTDKLI